MSSMFLIAIVVHVLLATATGYDVLQDQPKVHLVNMRIVGGNRTTVDKYPYQLSLQRPYFLGLLTQQICGASIISEDWAVTAAHCTYGMPTEIMCVRAGTSFYFIGGEIRTLARIVVHEDYDPLLLQNDIALIKVKEPFTFSEWIQPIPLQTSELKPGTLAYMSGWGNTREGGWMSPLQLRHVTVPIISEQECKETYGGDISKGNICAGYSKGRKDSCQGDSGGPLVSNGKLVGIVSWGNGCARPGVPGVYTKVSAYRKWIKKHSGV